jgi:tetratricopeptide (TPR) repeat protein
VAEYLLYGPTPYDQVIDLGRGLREAADRAGAPRALAFAAALTGEAALLSGDLDRAERELTEAVEVHRRIRARAGEAHSLQRLAELRLHQGRRDEARELLRQALPLARWSSLAPHLMQRIHGTAIAAADTPEEAYAAVARAEAITGVPDICPFCEVLIEVPAAIACAGVGDLEGARKHLARAEWSTRLYPGTSLQAGVVEARAHLLRAEGDESWPAVLAEAAEQFAEAGQPLDAARCRAAVASGVPLPT